MLNCFLYCQKYYIFVLKILKIKSESAINPVFARYIRNMKRLLPIYIIMCIVAMWSCTDEDYSVSSSDLLTFSTDTVHLDTVFCNTPTPTKDFWVYNKTGRSIRLQTVRLERGNQSGYRVNVDGVYLGPTTGYQTNEVEVRKNDSIRVFIELTAIGDNEVDYKRILDNIVFTTEGGAVQKVALDACSWNAVLLNNPVIKRDTTFTAELPIVISGNLKVDSLATLTLNPGTRLYFHDDSKLDVYGRLVSKGTPDNEVVLRGYRLDNMFDYLPYDRVSGQWGGVEFHESSYDNEMNYTDLHSSYNGIIVDSCDISKQTLVMNACTVHNCQGYGIRNLCSWIELYNCQITNTLYDCLCTNGGVTLVDNCTLAQFYPYDSNRGVALRFNTDKSSVQFLCYNTLVTGYADDEIMGENKNDASTFYYEFHNCILRTPEVTTADSTYFDKVIFEDIKDTLTTGRKHFVNIDTKNLKYDFRLDSISPAIDIADPLTAMPTDRNGLPRDERPDIGAFEHKK